jgi:hypothetical protein
MAHPTGLFRENSFPLPGWVDLMCEFVVTPWCYNEMTRGRNRKAIQGYTARGGKARRGAVFDWEFSQEPDVAGDWSGK